MNEKTRTILFFLLCFLIFAISILSGIILNNLLDKPEFCNTCHEMQPFYSSYQNPENGSIISAHELNCIQCHAGRNINDAKKQVLTNIIIYRLNLSFIFTPMYMKPDCSKCHPIPINSVHNDMNSMNCTQCHFAHNNSSMISIISNKSLSLISYGSHRNQTCLKCHSTTFQIPRCVNCHSGHGGQKLENNLCLICHKDPHIPTKPGILPKNTVTLTKDLPFSACQPCHEKEYSDLINSESRHNDMQTCSICHVRHGSKPGCYQCHKAMKVQRHLTNLKCSDCHSSPKLEQCKTCHGISHDWSGDTAMVPEN